MKYPENRNKFPCVEAFPEDFLTNDEIEKYIKNIDSINFKKDDWKKLLNCVHCNECGTSHERALLLNKYVESRFEYPDLENIQKNFQMFDTPYPTNQMRIKIPPNISSESDTLFFMGCLSTIRIPRYTEHALEYLLKNNIKFTILEKEICCGYPAYAAGLMNEYKRLIEKNKEIWKKKGFKKIICLCPACFFIFKRDYNLRDIEVKFIVDFLKPSSIKKSGSVSIQYLCQLNNRGFKGYDEKINQILRESGYEIIDIPHWCCGGGIGYFGRIDVINKIAEKRMKDFRGNYYTTYCSGCFWILKTFKKHLEDRNQIELKDIFELIS